MRWVVQGAVFFGVMGFFASACGGSDSGGGTAGGGGSGAFGTGGATSGGSSGDSSVGGASGSSGTSGGGGASGSSAGGSGGGGGFGADAGLPDVSFTYDPPDAGPDDACAAVTASAATPPVDIIWIIDQSCSMSTEIAQVKANVNGNFATIIQNSGLDYRVIMFANYAYPTVARQVCVLPPLGAATCGQNNPPKFFQVNRSIESTDSLSLFMNTTYWTQIKANLRPNAYKAFIEVTDDQSGTTAAVFDTFLLTGGGVGYFGTATKRNYTFHSIIGVPTPLAPTAPKATTACSTAVNTGPQYQDLSILTGGLRHPVCDTNYSTVFNNIATNIVKAVACELLTPPASGDGGVIDWSKVQVQYTPGGTGTPTTYPQVANAAACTGDGFYYDNPANPTKVTLCPSACTTVSADKSAKVDLLLGCLGS